jgi:excisionase family DNA binding protein
MATSARRTPVVREEILTLQDVADLLKVGLKTAYTMAQQGDLPGFKVGQQWRFKLGDINGWIEAQKAAQKKPPSKTSRLRKGARA